MSGVVDDEEGNALSFHHVHVYVDVLEDLKTYKTLENQLNTFARNVKELGIYDPSVRTTEENMKKARSVWRDVVATDAARRNPCNVAAGRDIVRQLLAGPGFRITGAYEGKSTRSFLLTSRDFSGSKFLVTAPLGAGSLRALASGAVTTASDGEVATKKQRTPVEDVDDGETYAHFSLSNLRRSVRSQAVGKPGAGPMRQSMAVLAFEATDADTVHRIHQNYAKHHPKLLNGEPRTYGSGDDAVCVFEVFAYYRGDVKVSEVDRGTLIRFMSRCRSADGASGGTPPETLVVPGISRVAADFDVTADALPMFSDHWVSNVLSRQGFLSTLHDTLGFNAKVNFNAGVVAAGEAQIESTVTGNASTFNTTDMKVALRNMSQIYMPINNALSAAGHVRQFLDEIGQGVQHVANRCDDIVALISRTNYFEGVTGEAFTFLNIPRSYYGRLVASDIAAAGSGVTEDAAAAMFDALRATGVVDGGGICRLEVTDDDVRAAVEGVADSEQRAALGAAFAEVAAAVKRSRYINLHKLLKSTNMSAQTYMDIVRNKILVDIQGKDILFQIFTGNVLQRKPGEEAPFVEFIQRLCDASVKTIRSGCGGFGIRNFLTLFLSIEVSKAMAAGANALAAGNAKDAKFEQRRVDLFTYQLDTSNPVLTAISDAMTAESDALRDANGAASPAARAEAERRAEHHRVLKEQGNKRLMEISTSCMKRMQAIREERELTAEQSERTGV